MRDLIDVYDEIKDETDSFSKDYYIPNKIFQLEKEFTEREAKLKKIKNK